MNNVKRHFEPKGKRNYKDTLFRMIFKEPAELLELYNAMNGTEYTHPEDLEIVTLENAVYMSMKNDVAFVVGYHLNLYEQQATVNPNMPLRFLQYVAKEYERLVMDKNLYSTKTVKIPTPNFVVFYNGTREQPECVEMKLSDAYEVSVESPALELKVIQLNINSGHNKELLEKCRTLKEYTLYVERVRGYAKVMPLTDAVNQAVRECIKEGILSEFLTKNRAEAISMSIFEYDEEKVIAMIRQEEHQDGVRLGLQQGLETGIQALIQDNLEEGVAPERIRLKLQKRFRLSEEEAEDYLEKYGKRDPLEFPPN